MRCVYRQTPDNLTISILCFHVSIQLICTYIISLTEYLENHMQKSIRVVDSLTPHSDVVLLNFAGKTLKKIARKMT